MEIFVSCHSLFVIRYSIPSTLSAAGVLSTRSLLKRQNSLDKQDCSRYCIFYIASALMRDKMDKYLKKPPSAVPQKNILQPKNLFLSAFLGLILCCLLAGPATAEAQEGGFITAWGNQRFDGRDFDSNDWNIFAGNGGNLWMFAQKE